MCGYLVDKIQKTNCYNLLMIIWMSQYSYIYTTKETQLLLTHTAILGSYSKTKTYLREGNRVVSLQRSPALSCKRLHYLSMTFLLRISFWRWYQTYESTRIVQLPYSGYSLLPHGSEHDVILWRQCNRAITLSRGRLLKSGTEWNGTGRNTP